MNKPKERPILFSTEMMRRLLAGEKTQTRRLIEWQPLEEGLSLSFSGLSVGEYCTGDRRSGYVLRSQSGGCWQDRTMPLKCKLGYAGDLLWTREAWAQLRGCAPSDRARTISRHNRSCDVIWRADGPFVWGQTDARLWLPGDPSPDSEIPWRPSIHMPRWASRCTLELTRDRLPERLRSITEEDAMAEGFRPVVHESWSAFDPHTEAYPEFMSEPTAEDIARFGYQNVRHHGPKVIATARDAFRTYWDGQYGKRDGGRCSWDANPWVQPYEFKVVNRG